MDNERLIGDPNLSCSLDRKGVPEGDAGASDLKSARASGLSGGVGAAAIVCSACALLGRTF